MKILISQKTIARAVAQKWGEMILRKVVCPNCENTGTFTIRVDNDWEEIAEEYKLVNEVEKEGIKDDTGCY